MKIITLTTDFGSTDPCTGIVKGVILNICPEVTLVDISHDIKPQDIAEANFILQCSYNYFPCNTIHICIVDPGVGSKRKSVLIKTNKFFFIGPDNGLFTSVINNEIIENVIELTEKKYWLPYVSQTFHGRDIFAPVAAHLVKGEKIENFGKQITKDDLIKLPIKNFTLNNSDCSGFIQHIDRFGNIITNIPCDKLPKKIYGKFRNFDFSGLINSYSDARPNTLSAIKGSNGYLELFISNGNAEKLTGALIGEKVDVKYSL